MKNVFRISGVILLFFIIHSCKKDNFAIGEFYQGGIIGYILLPGDPGYIAGQTHGLIAAPDNQSTGIPWFNGKYIEIIETKSELGTGNANTNAIVGFQGAGSYAAKLCYDLVLGGYSDWYLPSKDELSMLYFNRAAVGGYNSYGAYWSSTESSPGQAWVQAFEGGNQGALQKLMQANVRAVRSF